MLDDKGKPIKPYRKPDDNRPAEVRLIEYLSANPKAMEQWERLNAKKQGAITEKDLLTAYGQVMRNAMPSEQKTFQEWVRSSGFGQPQASQKPSTETAAHADAKKRLGELRPENREAGKAEINKRLQAWGYKPID